MSLADLRPDLIKFWSEKNEYSPWEVGVGSTFRAWWKCPKGIHDDYEYNCNNRSRKAGCRSCVGLGASERLSTPPCEKSLAYLYPDIAETWSPSNPVTPDKVYPSSHKPKYKWICTFCKKEYSRTCHGRQVSGRCKGCAGKSQINEQSTPPKSQSLAHLYPDISETWNPRNSKTPWGVYPFANKIKYLWNCTECGEEYKRTCADRHRSSLCEDCSREYAGKKLSTPTHFHSFADLYPELLREYSKENSRNPYSVKPGSNYTAQWVCGKGHEWDAPFSRRTGPNKTGCPHCFSLGASKAERLLREALIPHGAESTEVTIGKWDVDIYITESKTVVEYDGSYFHSFEGCADRDRRKSLELLEMGYRVIRVRTCLGQYRLESLGIEDENYFEVFCEEPIDSEPSEELIEELTNIMKNF